MPTAQEPTPEQASLLLAAVDHNFPTCDCHRHGPRGDMHPCSGHAFLHEDPTRRGKVEVWQRLVWVRSQLPTLRAQEGLSPEGLTPAQEAAAGTLPW